MRRERRKDEERTNQGQGAPGRENDTVAHAATAGRGQGNVRARGRECRGQTAFLSFIIMYYGTTQTPILGHSADKYFHNLNICKLTLPTLNCRFNISTWMWNRNLINMFKEIF